MADELVKNSLRLELFVNPHTDAVDIQVGHNLDLDNHEEALMFYLDALNGIVHDLKINMEGFAVTGNMLRQLSNISRAIMGEDIEDLALTANNGELDIEFEPDQALMDAIEENKDKDKVIKFKPKNRIH